MSCRPKVVPACPGGGASAAVRPADGALRKIGSVTAARRLHGGLDEETALVEFDADCDADIIFGYDWLRAHDLKFVFDSDAVCLCAERAVQIGPPRPPGPHPRRAGLAGDAHIAGRGPRTTSHRRSRRGADARPSVPLAPPLAGPRSAIAALAAVAGFHLG